MEEDHAQGLKKLSKATHESIRRQDARHGTYAQQLEAMLAVHERMADNGMQYALSLHQMHEDLNELANNVERGRKHWKQIGTSAEKKVQDAEAHMEKAKAKYDSLAEDYDRVRTGDKSTGRSFGLKGMKSGAQLEEDLKRKLDASDADYASKVQAAQAQRQELESSTRPEAVKKLLELITECDSALALQLQKYGASGQAQRKKQTANPGAQPRSTRSCFSATAFLSVPSPSRPALDRNQEACGTWRRRSTTKKISIHT